MSSMYMKMREELLRLTYGVWAFAILLAPHDSEGLRMIQVKVPPYKLKGETAVLECLYELEGYEKLYTVKWYRENEEFYRYVPKYDPPQISYRVEGIRVDEQRSDETRVTLKSVNLKTTANYRCEVSAEAPSFSSGQGSGRLEVVILPTSGPHISGERTHYLVGDEIDLNCTSGKSYPASELRWHINDREVTNPEFLRLQPQIVHPHGLITTALGLRLPAAPSLFQRGSMRVRCVASVSPVLWQGDRESVVETPLVTNREALLLDSEGLRMIQVKVPPYKLKGETAVLECLYELEGYEKLYTVKWYRENEEFYRYVPKYDPPQISYRVEGIRVDEQRSDETRVTLKSVNLKTTANYRCEVSAEAPSFSSGQGSGRLEVVILPTSGPHISGERTHYLVGDEIDLNCTSGKSYPASELRWHINDREVTNPEFLRLQPQIVHPHGLITTALGLRLPAAPSLFQRGSMRVRCVASVSPVLWQGDRESVVETPLVTNREALLLVRSNASVISSSLLLVLILLIANT